MLRATTFRYYSGQRRFVKACSRKSQRETSTAPFSTSRKHRNGATIKAARQKKATGNICDEMRLDRILQKRTQLLGRRRKLPGALGIAGGGAASTVVPRARSRDAAS